MPAPPSALDLQELRDRAIRALRLAIKTGDESRAVAAIDAILEAATASVEERIARLLDPNERPTEPPPPAR